MAENEAPKGPDAALQKYSIELLACLDEMKYKRDALHKQILNEMQEKERLQLDLRRLTDMLVKVNETICDKVVARNRLDQTIQETEAAFSSMATGSENLIKFMKKVTGSIMPLLQEPEPGIEVGSKKKRTPRKSDSTPTKKDRIKD